MEPEKKDCIEGNHGDGDGDRVGVGVGMRIWDVGDKVLRDVGWKG